MEGTFPLKNIHRTRFYMFLHENIILFNLLQKFKTNELSSTKLIVGVIQKQNSL